jgi:hypothetical protein
MAIEYQPAVENTSSPSPADKVGAAPITITDQRSWQKSTSQRTAVKSLMESLGLNNFVLESGNSTDQTETVKPVDGQGQPAVKPDSGANTLAPRVETRTPGTDKPVSSGNDRVSATDTQLEDLNQSRDALTNAVDTRLPRDYGAAFKANMQKFEEHAKSQHLPDAYIAAIYKEEATLLTYQPKDLKQSRDLLTNAVDTNLPPDDAAAFKANMRKFEERAESQHLPDDEVAATYKAEARLLYANIGSADVNNRHRLAQQVMEQAANPNKARTGMFSGTCLFSNLESILYSRQPSKAADLIAQSAIYGEYRTQQGSSITADLIPTYESDYLAGDARSYASQVFQSVAVNAGLKTMGDVGAYRYDHDEMKPGQNDEYYVDGNGQRHPFELSTAALLFASNYALTGRHDLVLIDSGAGANTDNLKHVQSAEELTKVVTDLQKDGHLPATLVVDERNQPFWTQDFGHYTGNERGPHWHAITIAGYDSETGAIEYHNGWDSYTHQISAADLYRSTRDPRENLPGMEKDFVASKQQGNGNYAEALDALRISSETGVMSDLHVNRLYNRDLEGLIAKLGTHALDDLTVRRNVQEICAYLKAHQAFVPNSTVKKLLDHGGD